MTFQQASEPRYLRRKSWPAGDYIERHDHWYEGRTWWWYHADTTLKEVFSIYGDDAKANDWETINKPIPDTKREVFR